MFSLSSSSLPACVKQFDEHLQFEQHFAHASHTCLRPFWSLRRVHTIALTFTYVQIYTHTQPSHGPSLNMQIPNAALALSPQFVDIAANRISISLQRPPPTHTALLTAVWWVWDKEELRQFYSIWPMTNASHCRRCCWNLSKQMTSACCAHTCRRSKRETKTEKKNSHAREVPLFACVCACTHTHTLTHIQTDKYIVNMYVQSIYVQHAPAANRRTVGEIALLTAINL